MSAVILHFYSTYPARVVIEPLVYHPVLFLHVFYLLLLYGAVAGELFQFIDYFVQPVDYLAREHFNGKTYYGSHCAHCGKQYPYLHF